MAHYKSRIFIIKIKATPPIPNKKSVGRVEVVVILRIKEVIAWNLKHVCSTTAIDKVWN